MYRNVIYSLLLVTWCAQLFGNPFYSNKSSINDDIEIDLVEIYSTIQSIGLELHITGDDNHNATCAIHYRKKDSNIWLEAQDLFRVDFREYNMMAGSILFLEENSEYEIEIDLVDPDGGGEKWQVIVQTQILPRMPNDGRTHHVIPGNGLGSGSEADPFQGIANAQNNANPGDVFLLHQGDYGKDGQIYFTKSGEPNQHIVWMAFGDGDVIMNQVRIEADHIWLNGIKFIYNENNGTYGLRTSPPGPKGVVITNNHFEGCHICIYLNDGGDNWYITDNVIIGDNDPQNGSDFSGEGIELWHTSGHTVAYNKISNVGDGISYPHNNVDIFNNDIFDTTDDGIEGDYGHNNVRIWSNRISNTFNNGISFQPMNGAPWYVLFNQVAAPGENALKFRDRVDRVLLAHNTLVAWSGVVASGSEFIRNIQSTNNLWITIQDRYIWENGANGDINWKTNLDYDGFDWGNNSLAFKWGGLRLKSLEEFQSLTGHELNAIRILRNSCFENFEIDNPPPASIPFQYFSLKEDCNAVDAGLRLNNINDKYLGTAPDMGAYEWGSVLPHYGPRDSTVLTDIHDYSLLKHLKKQLSIVPNPVGDELFLQRAEFDKFKYSISDINGRVVLGGNGIVSEAISTKSLISGTYFISIFSNTNSNIIQFVKK